MDCMHRLAELCECHLPLAWHAKWRLVLRRLTRASGTQVYRMTQQPVSPVRGRGSMSTVRPTHAAQRALQAALKWPG
eukprot:CAMPEP_0179072156 /NCGR_PEP_ID=MMETSP0796-20121207/31909_1 /TAXON_ID=73915 /ORGANISM="Pyrodinium bahamense, Strain pbaha01" /LENGTH=76 /DNA_ID=CAMNT_0020769307 /DNA_START=82 /DNA_END=308 /DNA_ORIENTATION=-